ncbi:MAG TPA: alpha/beta hydrolase [Frankiaceae bacterium]|nr:alpha/beta hydrolase [Frankiaceae bacterium]
MKTGRLAGAAYLAASSFAAVNVLNAYRPLARRGQGSIISFATGFVTSEIPRGSVGLSVAESVVALSRGAARSTAGKLGLALSAASVAGLIGLELRARPAEAILDSALRAGLGPDYLDDVLHPARPDSDKTIQSQPSLLRTLRANKRYAHHSDIGYGPAGSRNHLDIWRRGDLPPDGTAPVLVQVHGGAWMFGNKLGQAYPLMSHLVERGWICVSLNYRLSPRSTWPDQILDVKRAVAWVKQHIDEYGGDPNFVAITGGSAGGHLTALHALTAADRTWQPDFEDVDTSVVAAVPFYGVYDWTNRDGHREDDVRDLLEKHVIKDSFEDAWKVFDAASPMSHVRVDAPPFFCLHGNNDTLVPVAQARAFVRRLREVSTSPVVYAEFPGAQHAFDVFASTRANAAAEAVERFLGVVYGEYQGRSRPVATGLEAGQPQPA